MKEIGRLQQYQQISAVEAYTPALFTRVLGWNKLEVDDLIAKVKNELTDKNLHLYVEIYFVWGRKPDA
jgi:pantothenate kinase-related protein Tda10